MNIPIPERTTRRIFAELPESDYARLDAICRARNATRAAVVRAFVQDGLNRYEEQGG